MNWRKIPHHLKALLKRDGTMNETWFELKERLWHYWYMNPRNILKYGDRDFPKMITLETQTVCNRRCHYCPNADAPMEFAQMSVATFKNIVARMVELDFCGFVVLSSFSEPLLDPRLTPFVKYLKQELPRCRPAIFTNGDYLDTAKCQELVDAGVSYIHITRHPPYRKQWDEAINKLRHEFPKHIQFRGVLDKEPWLFNFAGTVPNPPNASTWTTCDSVKWNVTIYADGSFPLCANLPEKKPVFGNLNTESWMEIWRKPKSIALRNQAKSGKPTIDVCKACYDRSADAHIRHAPRLAAAKALFPNAKTLVTREQVTALEKAWKEKHPDTAVLK